MCIKGSKKKQISSPVNKQARKNITVKRQMVKHKRSMSLDRAVVRTDSPIQISVSPSGEVPSFSDLMEDRMVRISASPQAPVTRSAVQTTTEENHVECENIVSSDEEVLINITVSEDNKVSADKTSDKKGKRKKRSTIKKTTEKCCYKECKAGLAFDKDTIQCNFCMEWIHVDCAKLSQDHKLDTWNCEVCRQMPSNLNSLQNTVKSVQQELSKLCTLNADLLKMLATKTEECEILRNELKEMNDSVNSFSSLPAKSWEVQGKRQRPAQRSQSINQRNVYTQQPRQNQIQSRTRAQLQPQTVPVNYTNSHSNQQLQSVQPRVQSNETPQPQLQGSDRQTQLQPQSVPVYNTQPHSNQQLQSAQSGIQLIQTTQSVMGPNQAKPQPGRWHGQAQPQPAMQLSQAQRHQGMQLNQVQPHPGMQLSQAEPQPGMQPNQSQPEPGMQFSQAQPQPGMLVRQAQLQPGMRPNQAQQVPKLQYIPPRRNFHNHGYRNKSNMFRLSNVRSSGSRYVMNNQTAWRDNVICHFCGESGHVKRSCRHKSVIKCLLCENLGHKQKDCPFG